ncbi:PTS fructose transporter subunit IIA [Caproiciproducens sp. NJN-50]|uniref:PTS sugar transporter subunit IIA n=1 Tax=Acutalibacteraceae TaxID=3082771 RepID=UPI000FFE0DCA|nr:MULTISPECIES: fructose PTS transporter subunit IIA [Acutalibacteraceae]QAT50788.1 PTS fructose transporter subunit IIA [Caproiciproducens sp. NJN-50]
MNIADIMDKNIIFLDLAAADRDAAVEAMIDGMFRGGYILDREKYLSAVRERESKGTTGIGFGVAIPHGKSDGVRKPCVAFAKLKKPVDWNSFDGKKVSNVFLIGVPEKNAGNDHLKILIALSKKLMHEDFRERLEQAVTADDILSLIESVEA